MCDPATIGLIIQGVGAGVGVYGAVKGGPKIPGQAATQAEQSPIADVYKKQTTQRTAAPAAKSPDTLLGGGGLPSANSQIAKSTLLGQ